MNSDFDTEYNIQESCSGSFCCVDVSEVRPMPYLYTQLLDTRAFSKLIITGASRYLIIDSFPGIDVCSMWL
jgi:hypothetical protein